MKLHIGCLTLAFLSLALSAAAQVAGTGTTGYIPFWTDSTTLGDSTIFEKNSAVGINTAAPTATLSVVGPNDLLFNKSGFKPFVLQVTGGTGLHGIVTKYAGPGGPGSSISLTSGAGGSGGCLEELCGLGGPGGSIQITAGSGGGGGGNGGSITVQPGAGGASTGSPGNLLLAPSGGLVGLGTSIPTATFDVVAGGTTLADAWTTRSSRRFKTNIQPLTGALEKVEKLQGVSYERKVDGKHEIGVVAEDVAEVIPEVVSRNPETHEVQGVDYSRLAALLIEAVKSQQAELQSQQEEIQQLKAQIRQLGSSPVGQ